MFYVKGVSEREQLGILKKCSFTTYTILLNSKNGINEINSRKYSKLVKQFKFMTKSIIIIYTAMSHISIHITHLQ